MDVPPGERAPDANQLPVEHDHAHRAMQRLGRRPRPSLDLDRGHREPRRARPLSFRQPAGQVGLDIEQSHTAPRAPAPDKPRVGNRRRWHAAVRGPAILRYMGIAHDSPSRLPPEHNRGASRRKQVLADGNDSFSLADNGHDPAYSLPLPCNWARTAGRDSRRAALDAGAPRNEVPRRVRIDGTVRRDPARRDRAGATRGTKWERPRAEIDALLMPRTRSGPPATAESPENYEG
jgi:hypothetical protein